MNTDLIIPGGPHKGKILIKISQTKPIYLLKDEENILVKICPNNKKTLDEIEIQSRAFKIVSCPEVIEIITYGDKIYFLMKKINAKTVYELYGDDPKKIPKKIWDQIHSIIVKLYYYDIHYLDISAYNFMVDDKNKIFVIDFGDAKIVEVNWFLKDFIDGEKAWNPDFF